MEHKNWTCGKCNGRTFDTSEFRATGGLWTKLFGVQTRRFTTVTCSKCKFTEIYKADQSMLGNIFDLLT